MRLVVSLVWVETATVEEDRVLEALTVTLLLISGPALELELISVASVTALGLVTLADPVTVLDPLLDPGTGPVGSRTEEEEVEGGSSTDDDDEGAEEDSKLEVAGSEEEGVASDDVMTSLVEGAVVGGAVVVGAGGSSGPVP
eukprot:Colp12_sorted_trinity150504_noHs@30084